jgi:chitin disaccharide deacetylase
MTANHAGARPQRRILICADDFGHSRETSHVILDLLSRGKINATSCLVESGAWATLGGQLRQIADARNSVAVGLHLNLTERFAQDAFGSLSPPDLIRLTRLLMLPIGGRNNNIYVRMASQWDLFVRYFGREPDFVDGHQHVHLSPAAWQPLMRLLAERRFGGWIRQCRTSSDRTSPKQMLLNRLSGQFKRNALKHGFAFNAGFGGLRRFGEAEDIAAIWRTDLAAMPEHGVLMVHPGADVNAADPIGRYRVQEARLLESDWMQETLDASGFSLNGPLPS